MYYVVSTTKTRESTLSVFEKDRYIWRFRLGRWSLTSSAVLRVDVPSSFSAADNFPLLVALAPLTPFGVCLPTDELRLPIVTSPNHYHIHTTLM